MFKELTFRFQPDIPVHLDRRSKQQSDNNDDDNNKREFIERFQRHKALYNLIKQKPTTRKYTHTNQWYINKQTNKE